MIGVLTVALCFANCAAGICKTSDEAFYERAQWYKKAGHLDKASEILSELYRKNPQNASLLVELGETYFKDTNDMAGGLIKAEQCFRKAIRIAPEFGKAYYMMSELANAQSKYDLAIQMAGKALSVKKPDTQAYMERAASYSRLHKDKEALLDLDKYIALHRQKRNAYERRASILENLHLYERALADFRTMQKIHCDDRTALKEAFCLDKLNKREEAITCLNNLLGRNPEDDAGYEARGKVQVKLGRLKEAIADYSRAIQLIPSANVYKERAAAYEKLGRKDLAEQDLKEAERI
ncbi:MAG: tetratricopeptide repeat protein [Candidatus Melainabacteria bacterium]|nr:tetratricopeptide repeat protein [Candidatus Melainabacteria bacterium]